MDEIVDIVLILESNKLVEIFLSLDSEVSVVPSSSVFIVGDEEDFIGEGIFCVDIWDEKSTTAFWRFESTVIGSVLSVVSDSNDLNRIFNKKIEKKIDRGFLVKILPLTESFRQFFRYSKYE